MSKKENAHNERGRQTRCTERITWIIIVKSRYETYGILFGFIDSYGSPSRHNDAL